MPKLPQKRHLSLRRVLFAVGITHHQTVNIDISGGRGAVNSTVPSLIALIPAKDAVAPAIVNLKSYYFCCSSKKQGAKGVIHLVAIGCEHVGYVETTFHIVVELNGFVRAIERVGSAHHEAGAPFRHRRYHADGIACRREPCTVLLPDNRDARR